MDKERLKWIVSGLDWEQLNDWELRFVESCEKRMEEKGSITEKMEGILEELYEGNSR